MSAPLSQTALVVAWFAQSRDVTAGIIWLLGLIMFFPSQAQLRDYPGVCVSVLGFLSFLLLLLTFCGSFFGDYTSIKAMTLAFKVRLRITQQRNVRLDGVAQHVPNSCTYHSTQPSAAKQPPSCYLGRSRGPLCVCIKAFASRLI